MPSIDGGYDAGRQQRYRFTRLHGEPRGITRWGTKKQSPAMFHLTVETARTAGSCCFGSLFLFDRRLAIARFPSWSTLVGAD